MVANNVDIGCLVASCCEQSTNRLCVQICRLVYDLVKFKYTPSPIKIALAFPNSTFTAFKQKSKFWFVFERITAYIFYPVVAVSNKKSTINAIHRRAAH